MNRYIKDGIKILLMSLPYCIVGVTGMLGELVDWSMVNSLGTIIVVAFGLFSSISILFTIIQKQISGNATILISSNYSEANTINNQGKIVTTAILLSFLVDIVEVLILVFFHKNIASLFAKDTQVVDLLSKLLLLRGINLPAQTINYVFDGYMSATRKNKLAIILSIIYYASLILSDLYIINLDYSAEYVFIATIVTTYLYCIYTYICLMFTKFSLGSFSYYHAKELIRRTLDTLTDKIAQRVTYFVQTLIVSRVSSTKGYAIYVVALTLVDLYNELQAGLYTAWAVYISEWLSGLKEWENSIYDRAKDMIAQIRYYNVIAIIFQYLIYISTAYLLWWVFGQAVEWKDCKIYIIMLLLQNFPSTITMTYYETLISKGITKPIRYSAWIGGVFIRIPIQFIVGYILHLPLYLIPIANIVDYTVRRVYLHRKLLTALEKV